MTPAELLEIARRMQLVATELAEGRGRDLSDRDLMAAGFFMLGVLHGNGINPGPPVKA